MMKKHEIADDLCRRIGVTRKKWRCQHLSKRELMHVGAHITLLEGKCAGLQDAIEKIAKKKNGGKEWKTKP